MSKESSDILSFADEVDTPERSSCGGETFWKVLVVDDEEEVHAVTRMALRDFVFSGSQLEFLSAHTGGEAKRILAKYPDIAVVLLDVVMEDEHAGLEVVKYIRETLQNPFVRIILRTGQPGQAPERRVVQEYDINDYKEKTELTAQKLFTCIFTALGNYRALTGLDTNRRGLIKIIEASADIFEKKSIDNFLQGVLEQVTALLFLDKEAIYVKKLGITSKFDTDQQVILAATGSDRAFIGRDPRQVLPHEINSKIQKALTEHRSLTSAHCFTGYVKTRTGTEAIIFVSSPTALGSTDHKLLDMFFHNVTVGLENIHLWKDIEETQREIVYLLGDAVETRSNETGNHVRRVGEFARELSLLAGIDEQEANVLQSAAPLHDIGKIGIPDSILNKCGSLTEDEWRIMKSHTEQGARILGSSKRPILQAASIVASQHHENWDGSGYPNGLASEEISIYGRIVAIADVFDALCSDRCYKPRWELSRVVEFMKEQRGKKFDPTLIDLFLDNLALFVEIRRRFPDQEPSQAG